MPAHRRMVARHQRRVAGHDAPEAVRGAFESYARYWVEMLRLPEDVRRNDVASHFTASGYENVANGLARGRGVVVALPHLGGWECAAAWMAHLGHRMLAVVEPVEPPELFEWFARQRHAIGLDIVPLGSGVTTAVLQALRDNRIVCLLCDRDLTGDGVEIEFFGERTTVPGGPATLALRAGATLLPTAVYFRGGRDHHAVIRPPIPVAREGRLRDDVVRITQQLVCEFEDLIRVAPEQWHLMQPNWPSDRRERPPAVEVSTCGS
jgi:KDO2-lipid IV(A) lauroyltransferase